MAPHDRSRPVDGWIEVPEGEFRFAFKFRAGPSGVPVLTGYAVFELTPVAGTPSAVKSRLPDASYGNAYRRAVEILVREGAWWEQDEMNPLPDALLDRAAAEGDVDLSDVAIKVIRSQKPASNDNQHYARCVIPYVLALREGTTESEAIDAAHAALQAQGLYRERGAVKDDLTVAKRRGLGSAAERVHDSGEELTPRTVVACLNGCRVVHPSPEAEELLREMGVEELKGGWGGWEEPRERPENTA